jgi:hypothetical protein
MPSRKPVVEIKSDSVSASKPKKKVVTEVEEVEDSPDEIEVEQSSEEEKVSKPVSKPKASIKKNIPAPKKKELIKKSNPIVKAKIINKVEDNELGSESDDEVKVPRSKPVSIPKKEPKKEAPVVKTPKEIQVAKTPKETPVIKTPKKEAPVAKTPKKETPKKKVVESDSDDNKHSTVIKSRSAKPNRWRDHVKKIQSQHKSLLYKDVLKLAAESYSKEN